MPRLCVFGCAPSGVPMHRFPNVKKFPDLFKSWVILVGGKLESSSDYEYYQKKRVCDIHFTDKDRNRNNRLNTAAIPSLHLPGSTSSQTVSDQPLTQHFHPDAISLTEGPSVSGADPELPSRLHLQPVAASQPAEVARCTNSTPKQLLLEHNYSMISQPQIMTGKGASKINRTCYVRPLCTKIKHLRTEISRLRKRGQIFKERLRNAETLFNNASFLRVAQNMTKPAQLFLHMQLQTTKKDKGRRFSLEEKVLALSLYKKSPKCYRLLHKYFTLPSSKTMKRLLSNIKITPGINKIIFEKLKKTILQLPVTMDVIYIEVTGLSTR